MFWIIKKRGHEKWKSSSAQFAVEKVRMPSRISVGSRQGDVHLGEKCFFSSVDYIVLQWNQSVRLQPACTQFTFSGCFWYILIVWKAQFLDNLIEKPPLSAFEQRPSHLVRLFRFVLDHPVPRNLLAVSLNSHPWIIKSDSRLANLKYFGLLTMRLDSCSHVVVLPSPAPKHVWKPIQSSGLKENHSPLKNEEILEKLPKIELGSEEHLNCSGVKAVAPPKIVA